MFTFLDLIQAFFGNDTTEEEFVEERPNNAFLLNFI